MKTDLIRVACAAAAATVLLLAAPLAKATVLTFDDLKGDVTNMPSPYGGFDWFGWQYFNTDQGNMPYTPMSGETRLLTSFGDSNSMFSPTATFVFEGAAFTGQERTQAGTSQHISYQLWLGANVVYSSGLFQVSSAPTFIASGYASAVDRLVVLNDGQQRFVMDDVTYSVSAVPEPSRSALLLGGLGVMGLLVRRQVR